MIFDNILSLIGNTPVLKLNKIEKAINKNIFVKLESYNPGGSSKDRVAKNIIEEAEKRGDLTKEGTIVESSSGNLAIGLALVGKQKGYKVKCIVDPKINHSNLQLIIALGAEVIMVDNSDKNGNYLKERIRVATELAKCDPTVFWPNQYNNPANPEAYANSLALEIHEDFGANLDLVIAPVGTAGLITGCAKKLKELNPNIKIMAVDAVGSVIFDTPSSKRLQVGIGAAIVPGNLDKSLYDYVTHVNDYDAFTMTRQLALEEGVLVGGSSGAAVHAALTYANRSNATENILVLLPDRGDRYINTIFSDDWMNENSLSISYKKELYV